MSGDELQVVPEDLTGKAAQIRGLSWSTMAAQPALISPDALIISSVAITNLAVNAEAMWSYQEFGRLEGQRLAQTLDNVAGAYAEVDQASGADIGSTMDGAGSGSGGIVYPKGVDLPAPPHPADMPIPRGQLASDQMLFPPEAQRALEAGDDGASLRAASEMWRANATSLEASAQEFETTSLTWEGEAADAAYAKFNAYRDWLISLAGSWQRLSEEADRIVKAHSAAKRDNQPLADEFERLQQEVTQNPKDPDNVKKVLRMGDLQIHSEEVRNQYSRDGQPYQVQPEDPPSPVVSGIAVTADDHRRARKPPPEERHDQVPGSGSGGNGGAPSGGEPPMPSQQSSTSAAEQASQEAQQGGQQGGGSQGGGQPGGGQQGGGSPGGAQPGAGMPGGGMPGGGKGDPKLPTAPSLRPAAVGGGGGGASGAGGVGGGGGVPSSPMQPAVGAETVAPTPVAAPVAPAAAAVGATPGGAGGGGMGGMAPMHGGQGGGSGEKKRNPQLSQDEELYTEERPWTEAVIGNRVRRRGAPDDMKKETQ